MRRAFFVAVLLVATEATGLRAQSKIGTEFHPYNLSDTIVVSANRLATPVRTSGSSITVITADQIEKSQAVMVIDVLRDVPGVSVVQSGGPGQQTSVFMRGANSGHTLVIIDGVEVNDPSSPNTAANLNNLPIDNIERIEILRGPQSVLYGSDAVGGVIQIFTRRGLGRPVVTVSFEAGSFNTFREHLAIRSGRDDVDYSLSVTRQDTDGISAAAATEGKPERDGYANTTLSAGFGLRPSDKVEMRFAGRLTEADTDLDQSAGIWDDPNYTMNSRERFFSAQMSHYPLESVWGHRLGFFITHYKRSTVDATDPEHPFDAQQTEYEGRRVKFDWQHVLMLQDVGRFTAGVETERDEQEESLLYFGSTEPADLHKSVRTAGLYALGEFDLAQQLYATAGYRYDDHQQFGSKATYRFAAVYLVEPIGLKFKGSYGTSFKAPSLVQLYNPWWGNLDLKPETGEGWETGFEIDLADGQFGCGATYFSNRLNQLIVYDTVGWRVVNVAHASSRGVEAFGEWTWPGASLRIDYTFTRARDEADKSSLLRRPRHQASLIVSSQATEQLSVNLQVAHVGKRVDMYFPDWREEPDREPERVGLIDYTVVNLGTEYEILPGFELRARVVNLLDAKYEEALNYGSTPISAHIGFRVTLQ